MKILSWNLSYGYGIGSEGDLGYTQKPSSAIYEALDAFADVIAGHQPDVVLLQEVDFESKRSHFIDQLGYLARRTGLIYRDALISWDHPYVPYPGTKREHHFGPIQSGGGILSRTPITRIHHELLPKPKSNSGVYNFFYLHRYLQVVRIQELVLMNVHFEAYDHDNRALHALKALNRMVDFKVNLMGGDFNGDVQVPHEQRDLLQEHFPTSPTFPSNEPVKVLDGFIVNAATVVTQPATTLNVGQTSDHFPICIEVHER